MPARPTLDAAPPGGERRAPSSVRAPGGKQINAIRALFSSAAIQMQQLARGYLARNLTPDELLVTSIFAMGAFPMLITPLLGGVLADRMDRKRLALTLDLCQMTLILAMALLLSLDMFNIQTLMVFSLASGTVMGFSMPVRQAMIPDMVGPEAANNGLVLFSGVFSMMMIVAPAISGVIIGAANLESAFYCSVGLFGISFPLLMKVPGGRAHVPARQEAFAHTVLDGFRYVRASQALTMLMISGALATIFYIPYMSLLPIFQRDVLKESASGLGLMFTASGVGALMSSLLLAFVSAERPLAGLMMAFAVAAGLAIAGFSQSTSFPLSLGALVLIGMWQSGSMTMNMALIQYLAPREMRGRVFAIRMIVWGMMPVGQVALGLGARASSPEMALMVMGLAGSAVQVILWVWMRRVRMEIPQEAGTEPGGQASRPAA
jgi:MFS family permease